MHLKSRTIVPYESYLILGVVVVSIVLLLIIRLASRDNQFISDSTLYVYAQPDQHLRKNHMNKRQDHE
jgi:hypothetical protein